jgi:hypothetical protein
MHPANRYVIPNRRHLTLLHGNVLHQLAPEERVNFGRELADDARHVTDDDLTRLLDDDWRSQLTAGWLIGLTRRDHYRDRLGELLLASRVTFAGQGFCFALARFGTAADARVLSAYLDRYLPQQDLRADQGWAMGALLHVDPALANRHLAAWQQWSGRPDAEAEHDLIRRLCAFADDCMHAE